MVEAQSGERRVSENRQGFAGKVAGLFHRNPPIWEVVKSIEAQNVAEAEERLRQARVEEQLKLAKEPVIDALNNSGLDFSRSFTVTVRPGRRQELPGSTRDRVHCLAYIDAEFNVGDGSLRMLRGTTTEYPRSRLPLPENYRYASPPADNEEYFFALTAEVAEDGTGTVKDMLAAREKEAGWGAIRAYDFAGSTLRQLQHFQDLNWLDTTYFDGPVAEPLDRPEPPKHLEGPSPRYEYPYPPAC